jgi:DNA-binding NtrC family response regulator
MDGQRMDNPTSPVTRANVLIVDDEATQCQMLAEALVNEGYEAVALTDPGEALQRLGREHFDILISDYKMPDMTGIEFIQAAKAIDPDMTAFIVTAYGTVETAVAAMKLGASDFLTKPIELDHLFLLLTKAEEKRQLIRENRLLREQLRERHGFPEIVGKSPAMQEVFSIVHRVAATQATVLVRGESGAGKGLIARLIHDHSTRCDKPFITVHCAALPESLLESELFGHEKGAFTGALRTREGKFQAARGGTLFLDEIGEISPSTQVKLLRFLQERTFERVGSNLPIQVDVRLIAATNRDLEKAIREGAFREDLYYRINVVAIPVPPLRARREDLPVLIDHFLTKYAQANHRKLDGYSREFYECLVRHAFPGNIRELENIVENAVVLTRGTHLTAADLPRFLRESSAPDAAGLPADGEDLPAMLARIEREAIVQALEHHDYVQTRAAQALGLHERVLRYKIKKYALQTPHGTNRPGSGG